MPIPRPAPITAPGPRAARCCARSVRSGATRWRSSPPCARSTATSCSSPIPVPPTYLVTDPEAVRRVLVTNAKAYGKRTLQYTTLALVTGEGLLTADTEAWRPQRRLIQPAFHRASLELVAGHVRTAVDRLVERWSRCEGQVVDVDEAMMHLALEVVGSSLFGSDLSGRRRAARRRDARGARRRREEGALAAARSRSRCRRPRNVVLRRAVAKLDAAVDAMLADRAARPLPDGCPPRDMLDLLLAAHDDDGSRLSRRQVRDQVVTFIVAGHETVASALTWAWHLLATNPDALGRAARGGRRRLPCGRTGFRRRRPAAVDVGGARRDAPALPAGLARHAALAGGRRPRRGRRPGRRARHREPVARAPRAPCVAGPRAVRPVAVPRRRTASGAATWWRRRRTCRSGRDRGCASGATWRCSRECSCSRRSSRAWTSRRSGRRREPCRS